MPAPEKSNEQWQREAEELHRRLADQEAQLDEARETLRAIREGEVDALVVSTPAGQRIFTLQGVDQAYRTIVEQMQEGAVMLAEDGHINYCNRRFAHMLQRSLEEMIGSDVSDYVAASDKGRLVQRIRQALTSSVHDEVTLRASDETLVPIGFSLTAMLVDGRSLVCMVATDLTNHKRAEAALRELNDHLDQRVAERTEALRESEARFRLALRNAPVSVAAQDRELRYVWAYNQRTARLDEIVGRLDSDIFTPQEAARLTAIKRRVVEENIELHEQMWLDRPSGRTFLDICWEPIHDRAGQVIGVASATVDLTPVKLAEEGLAAAKAAAETANLTKSQFLANMSHELRTPMNAIIGMTAQALEEPLTATVRDCLETVKGSADSLHLILNEILDFSRIEAGKLAVEWAPFRLRAAVQDTLRLLQLQASQRGLTVETEILPGVPDEVVGDSLRLRQVLTNLVGNAIKFTERGGVTVRVAADPLGPHEVQLRFEVRDSGVGIAAERLAHIFDPFTQADASTTRKYGGTGLGLAITVSLVRLMGGTIDAHSEVGGGSTFCFTIRLRLPTEPLPAPCGPRTECELTSSPRPLRILLAEDTPANQKLIVRILGKRGHSVDVAGNGQEALDRVGRQDFDLVLMDVAMPVMDGFEATRAIRAIPDSHKAHVPIIAMTAHAMKGDRERCLDEGMDEYLSKPVDARELTRLAEELGNR